MPVPSFIGATTANRDAERNASTTQAKGQHIKPTAAIVLTTTERRRAQALAEQRRGHLACGRDHQSGRSRRDAAPDAAHQFDLAELGVEHAEHENEGDRRTHRPTSAAAAHRGPATREPNTTEKFTYWDREESCTASRRR
jgi:hypothetical protein